MSAKKKVSKLPEKTDCLQCIDLSRFKQGLCEDEVTLARVRESFRLAGIKFEESKRGELSTLVVYDPTRYASYSKMFNSLSSDRGILVCDEGFAHFLANNLVELVNCVIYFLFGCDDNVALVFVYNNGVFHVSVDDVKSDRSWWGDYHYHLIVPQPLTADPKKI